MTTVPDDIDTKANVRDGLIAWRDNAMKMDQPPWNGIVLLSHAIWWLAQGDEKAAQDQRLSDAQLLGHVVKEAKTYLRVVARSLYIAIDRQEWDRVRKVADECRESGRDGS